MAEWDRQHKDSEHLQAISVEVRSWCRWLPQTPGNVAEMVAALVALVGLGVLIYQVAENTRAIQVSTLATQVSIRGQLYQTEAGMAAAEAEDAKQYLATIWALVPPTVTVQEFSATLIRLVTDDPTALKAKIAQELHSSMFDTATFTDPRRRKATNHLRRLFLYTQTNFYHVHNAFDYWQGHILTDAEWLTWKNYIREMNAHPMLLTVIWQGYRYHYFSRAFGRFLQEELCADTPPKDDVDPEAYKRGKEFIRLFYPDMLEKDWPDSLPDY